MVQMNTQIAVSFIIFQISNLKKIIIKAYPNCTSTEYQCSNKRCIPQAYLCDRDDDCLDKSDEKFCGTRQCPPNFLSCNTTGQCINVEKFCDGVSDCLGKL